MKLNLTTVMRMVVVIIGGVLIIYLCTLMGRIAKSMMPSDEQQERLEKISAEVTEVDHTAGGIRRVSLMIIRVKYNYDDAEYFASITGRSGIKVGDMVDIYIDPDNPSDAWLAGRNDFGDYVTLTLVIVLVTVPLSLLLSRTLRRRRESE